MKKEKYTVGCAESAFKKKRKAPTGIVVTIYKLLTINSMRSTTPRTIGQA